MMMNVLSHNTLCLLCCSLKIPCVYLLFATLDILNLLLSEKKIQKVCSETFLVSIVNCVANMACRGNHTQIYRKRRKKRGSGRGWQQITMINVIVFVSTKYFAKTAYWEKDIAILILNW